MPEFVYITVGVSFAYFCYYYARLKSKLNK